MLVSSPITLLARGKSLATVSLLQLTAIFTLVPVFLVFQQTTSKLSKRRLLLFLLGLSFLSSLFLSDWIFSSFYCYSTFFTVLMNSAVLLETLSSSIFTKILPKSTNKSFFSASFLIVLFSTVGKAIGAILTAISSKIDEIEANNVVSICISAFAMLSLLIGVCFYTELRVKAIARLLKKDSIQS